MPASARRFLIASGSPDLLNTNAYLRTYAADGFAQAFPEAEIRCVAFEGLLSAVEGLRPDVVVVFGSVMPEQCDFHRVHAAVRRQGGRLVFWLHDDPYEFDTAYHIAPLADAVFTNDRATVAHYPAGLPTFHLPLAGCAVIHRRPVGRRAGPDWFFCGYCFGNRRDFMLQAGARAPHLKSMILGAGWDGSGLASAQELRVPNQMLPDFLVAARAVLNMGRSLDLANRRFGIRASTPGPRTFEAAMAGAAQVMVLETSLEILDYFEPDREILLADDADEFADHVARLAREPGLSEAMGQAAQARALDQHSYACRARTIMACLEA